MKYHISHFWDAQNPGNKKEFCDTVEKGLGPRPLGPIGPIFRRTITVTGKVQFLDLLGTGLSSIKLFMIRDVS